MEERGNQNEKKCNKEYAGQVVDIPRSKQRISFTDLLKKMTEKEGDPYLNIFSKKSIYLMTLFNFEKGGSIIANLPLRDMPLIKKNTLWAGFEIFKQQNQDAMADTPPAEEGAVASAPVPPAFTKLKIGSFAGKSPGDLLLGAKDPEKVKNDLLRQAEFLKKKLADYPANQVQINAIEDAVNSYEIGVLEDDKPSEDQRPDKTADAGMCLSIYSTPVKHQKKTNASGKNKCYSVKITCFPLKEYPYRIEIMNCYAPLGKLSSGITPVHMDKAEELKREYIDLTEAEWLYALDCLDENTKNTKNIWFSELRDADERNRWDARTP